MIHCWPWFTPWLSSTVRGLACTIPTILWTYERTNQICTFFNPCIFWQYGKIRTVTNHRTGHRWTYHCLWCMSVKTMTFLATVFVKSSYYVNDFKISPLSFIKIELPHSFAIIVTILQYLAPLKDLNVALNECAQWWKELDLRFLKCHVIKEMQGVSWQYTYWDCLMRERSSRLKIPLVNYLQPPNN